MAFLAQVRKLNRPLPSLHWCCFKIPILAFSFILVILKVSIKLPTDVQNQTLQDKLRRIDFLGSFTLVAFVGCLLLGFTLKSTEEMPWTHPVILGLFITSFVFGLLFVWVEKHWAPYPVMPMRLISMRTPLFVSLSNLWVVQRIILGLYWFIWMFSFGSIAAFSVVCWFIFPKNWLLFD